MTTGSINPGGTSPSGVIQASPLSEPGSGQQQPQVISAPTSAPGGNQQRANGPAGWTALGGTPIVVREGQTLAKLSERYNVPASAILSANGLQGAEEVRAGSTVVIPVYNAVGSQTASAQPAQTRSDASPSNTQSGEASARQASARQASAAPSVAPPRRPQQVASAARPAQQPQAGRDSASASAPQREAAPSVQQASAPQPQASQTNVAADGLDFRWPARGRVIAGFGTGGNEGINIALPEGTPVRAAEGGSVAYAGSELKGYGNLILIRHEDGYVSAYAHNRDLLVTRGDTVRRGQVISNSGRTGNVNAPQLHFEIRRGSDPIDPMPYLRG